MHPESQRIVIGIDPGYDRIGVAVVKESTPKPLLVFATCIETNRNDSHPKRLAAIAKSANELFTIYGPCEFAIEKLFFSKNVKTALAVAEARGVLLSEASKKNLTISEYNPSDVKIAVTGYGKSDKKHIAFMVEKLIMLEKKIRLDDEYDAIALCLAHLAIQKKPLCT